jgi:hypothetical protein
MTLLSLSSYLPAGDLARIMVAALVAAIIAPSAVAIGVVGLDRREDGSLVLGSALVAVAAATLALLVLVGVYALIRR